MSIPYTPPEFLENQSTDEIHRRMLDGLPSGIDKSEGNIPWDFTRPAALEKAELIQFELNETIKLIFPQWSYGAWLDLHAEKENIIRRKANKASGFVTVSGTAGTVVPAGFQFATPANLTASIIFETTAEVTITDTPTDIPIRAVDGGLSGNVAEDTVKLMVKPMSGISLVTNSEPITGGTPPEDDDSLRSRLLDAMRYGSSYVGNNADYVRWAKEVAGVGQVIVVPEAYGAGTVELIIVDSNGIPANQQILDTVYSHIAGTDVTDIERLAPIGAMLTVVAPVGLEVDISADVVLMQGENIETVKTRFITALTDYWLAVANETQESTAQVYIRRVQVGAILAKTPGVSDYSNLIINGDTGNIPVTKKEFPVTGEVTLNVQ